MVHVFHFLPTSMIFEIVNFFSWTFNAISSDKSCLISTWRQDTRIFPACWIPIGQFKFPARQPYARMLRDSVAAVVRARPRAIPLAMITMRKSTHGFPFLSHDEYGAPLRGPLSRRTSANNVYDNFLLLQHNTLWYDTVRNPYSYLIVFHKCYYMQNRKKVQEICQSIYLCK